MIYNIQLKSLKKKIMLQRKNILIIGGYGFLGQEILSGLNKNNHYISVIDSNIKTKALKDVTIKNNFNFSILDKKEINNALNSEKWDYLIHLAAFGGKGNGLLKAADEDFDKALDINVGGFANLLNNLKNTKTKVIWASSTVVFGEERNYFKKSIKEDEILNPSTKYGLTKLMAEQVANYYINNYKMKITGIRFPIIIGPGLNYRGVAAGISDMALAVMNKKLKYEITMPSSPLDVIYIKDAAAIVINMVNKNYNLKNIYNSPSIRTNSKTLANEFNRYYKNKNLKINDIGKGSIYPIMNWDSLKNDTNFKINYTIKKIVKDWVL